MKKIVTGTVLKHNSAKTITVMFERLVKYPKIGKYIHKPSVFKAHDEKNQAQVGDEVEITECRPVSKNKTWRLVKVTKKSAAKADEAAGETSERK